MDAFTGRPLHAIVPPSSAAIDARADWSQEDAAMLAVMGCTAPSIAETTRVMPTSTTRVAAGEYASVTTRDVVGGRASATSKTLADDAVREALPVHTGLSRTGPPTLAKRRRTPPGGSSAPVSIEIMAGGRDVAVAVKLGEEVGDTRDADGDALEDSSEALAETVALDELAAVTDGDAPVDKEAVAVRVTEDAALALSVLVLVVDADAPNE